MCQEWEGGEPVERGRGHFPTDFAEDLIMLLLFHHCTRIKSVVVLLSIDFTLKLIFISAEVHERYEGTFEEECRQQWCLRCHCEGCAGTYIVQKGSYTTL